MEYTSLQQDIITHIQSQGFLDPMDNNWMPPEKWGSRLGILRRCQELVKSGDLVREGQCFMKSAKKKITTKADIEAIWGTPMRYETPSPNQSRL